MRDLAESARRKTDSPVGRGLSALGSRLRTVRSILGYSDEHFLDTFDDGRFATSQLLLALQAPSSRLAGLGRDFYVSLLSAHTSSSMTNWKAENSSTHPAARNRFDLALHTLDYFDAHWNDGPEDWSDEKKAALEHWRKPKVPDTTLQNITWLESGRRRFGETWTVHRGIDKLRDSSNADHASYFSVDAAVDAPVVLVHGTDRETWKYFPGTEAPSPGNQCTTIEFDDSKWKEGAAAIGFGECASGKSNDLIDRGTRPVEESSVGTSLDDMQNTYSTVFVRRTFTVDDPSSFATLRLRVWCDDGFIAYLNGEAIGRSALSLDGDTLSHTATASPYRIEPLTSVDLELEASRLLPGRNVVAIGGVNDSLKSSDFLVTAKLLVTSFGGKSTLRDRLADLTKTLERRPELKHYLEGRLLQTEDDESPALAAFERSMAADPVAPEPRWRAAQCAWASGQEDLARSFLQDAMALDFEGDERLWREWAKMFVRPATTLADLTGENAIVLRARSRVGDGYWWFAHNVLSRGSSEIDCGYNLKQGPARSPWNGDSFYRDSYLRFGRKELIADDHQRDMMYRSTREFPPDRGPVGDYSLPVPRGTFEVTLHFCEIIEVTEGGRVFDVAAEGKPVIENLRLLDTGLEKPVTKTFTVKVDDGRLDLDFYSPAGFMTVVSGIEVKRR